MKPELWAAWIGALATFIAGLLGLLPGFLERAKKGDQRYKFVYVKLIHLRHREPGRTPVYRASIRRIAREIDVFDEYHFFRLNIFYRPQKEFRFSDRSSGIVDLQVIYPWQESLSFSDRGAGELLGFVEQTITTKSDVFLGKSTYYNALQDGHEDIGMKLERDTDEARIIIDFSSLPQHDRVFLSAPIAHIRDNDGRESPVGVMPLFPDIYAIEVKDGKKGQVIRVNFLVNWDDKYIFGYGSLINLESASRALDEPKESLELMPALLQGYRRSWSHKEIVFSRELGQEVQAAFLDLQESKGSSVNGVLIAVDQEKLRRLSLREKNYDLIDITNHVRISDISGLRKTARVFTFKGKAEYEVKDDTEPVYLLAGYREKVLAACQVMGANFVLAFDASTDSSELPVLKGTYTFVDTEQAKYV